MVRHLRRLLAPVLVAVLLLGAAGCGDDDGDADTTDTSAATSTSESTTTTEATTTSEPEPGEEAVRAYFLRGEDVAPVSRSAAGGVEPIEAALEALLAGPTEDEGQAGLGSAIPAGTQLLGVAVADGVARVDLSAEYGSGGGSLSMFTRIAQIVFTATQFDGVDGVEFLMDGEVLEALGGEGVILDGPQTRADWEEQAPAILVESPLPFEAVTSPITVTGSANTFEATFQLVITDGDGLIIHDDFVTATSGSGTRGTFEVTVDVEVPRAGVGSIIVFEESAEDGSQINLVEVPVRIS